MKWAYVERRGRYEPRPSRKDTEWDNNAITVCPARGYPLIMMSQSLFEGIRYDVDLGHVHSRTAAHTRQTELLENASSGGIITALAEYLLATERVDGVVTTRFIYGQQGPEPESFIARSSTELREGQGSKYCPVPALSALRELPHADEKVAFIGPPCQIAAVRLLKQHVPDYGNCVAYTIGNFCGGIRDLRHMRYLIKRQGFKLEDVCRFRFRGGGQPGSMLIEDRNGRSRIREYPDYGTDTGFTKLHRCRLCVDATAELADFACGDAWLERFLESENMWSIVLARSEAATNILGKMRQADLLRTENISDEEIKLSQRTNLLSKKERQFTRYQLYRTMGRRVPCFDGGFRQAKSSLKTELKVFLLHVGRRLLEHCKLYYSAIRIIRRLRNSNSYRNDT